MSDLALVTKSVGLSFKQDEIFERMKRDVSLECLGLDVIIKLRPNCSARRSLDIISVTEKHELLDEELKLHFYKRSFIFSNLSSRQDPP
jgi:hypothetical protein